MGHDVTANKMNSDLPIDAGFTDEVAYLRRSAFNSLNGMIYEALDAEKHNCGVSGCGTDQVFSNEQIRKALAKIPTDEEYDPERTFLHQCALAGCDVEIHFA